MLRRLTRHPAARAVLAWSLGHYLSLVIRTTRWSVVGEGHGLPFLRQRMPVILAFWHERLALVPAFAVLARRLFPQAGLAPRVLVSRHRDGRLIGRVVGRFGVTMVHGSSSRGGTAGTLELLRALRAGEVVVITPDGPRGPRRVAAPGVAQLAALSGAPVLPVAAATSNRRVLRRTWDRMVLPLPFGRGVLAIGAPITVARDASAAALPAIESALTAACEAADAAVADPIAVPSTPWRSVVP
ncbi:hypothetical protein GCM10010964_11170 [Caldovatus sediminis]|uniref:DUF374 domain-containing protein n=1 Tax=Caldovatus sediminis TaxID=2041189 RepID=A0A8J3ECT8_9PROT|nr:lysophospholipid acyltransferase family protein [Caldovatus sediminis]GGG24896.1 hypothetical protein GCM10010964_11170 [Caldovatus sediminis]